MTSRSEAMPRLALTCAHRGDSTGHRENTMAALRSAIVFGAEYVEVDVRVTRDGEVVLLHDETLERMWGLGERVCDLDWVDVARLGSEFERIPLLADALELFRDTSSVLVIDMDERGPAGPAFEVVRDSGIDVAWCGDLEAMRVIRSLSADARIWLPWGERVAPPRELLAELQPDFVNSEYVVLSQRFVDDVHALGFRVSCWTVDDAADMRWLIQLGVDSVTTNDITLFRRTLDEDVETWEFAEPKLRLASRELVEAHDTAHALAQWAIEYCRSANPGVVSTKAHPGDLVTEVDVAVERHVREVIAAKFPGHDFVGEELGGAARAGVPCWYLDPVDGTTNFANHIPWTSFSLALAVDRVPYVGVVADPWRGDLFEAVAGHGARLNGIDLRMAADSGTGDPLTGRVVSTELAGQLPWPGMIELLGALGARYSIMRIMGSATLTVVGVAAGRGAGSIIGQFSAVDHLAAALIVQEAGGVVLDSEGMPDLFPASGGLMVAVPEAANELHEVWRAARAAALHSPSIIPTA